MSYLINLTTVDAISLMNRLNQMVAREHLMAEKFDDPYQIDAQTVHLRDVIAEQIRSQSFTESQDDSQPQRRIKC